MELNFIEKSIKLFAPALWVMPVKPWWKAIKLKDTPKRIWLFKKWIQLILSCTCRLLMKLLKANISIRVTDGSIWFMMTENSERETCGVACVWTCMCLCLCALDVFACVLACECSSVREESCWRVPCGSNPCEATLHWVSVMPKPPAGLGFLQ